MYKTLIVSDKKVQERTYNHRATNLSGIVVKIGTNISAILKIYSMLADSDTINGHDKFVL